VPTNLLSITDKVTLKCKRLCLQRLQLHAWAMSDVGQKSLRLWLSTALALLSQQLTWVR